MSKKQLPLLHALTWIIGSTLLISGSAHSAIRSYFKYQRQHANDPRYALRTLIQTGPQKAALKTDYLAELLGLSVDCPSNTRNFNSHAAEQVLLRSPLISHAKVKLIPPDSLYIDYTVRQPLAWLADYDNTVIDKEGYPFPFRPFFSPKNLPELYLGIASHPFAPPLSGKPLSGKEMQLALHLLSLLSTSPFQVMRIDVSNAYAESEGRREIVLILEDILLQRHEGREVRLVFPKLLRLNTKTYPQELGNYLKLREALVEEERKTLPPLGASAMTFVREKTKVIDLRLPNLAFIEEVHREKS